MGIVTYLKEDLAHAGMLERAEHNWTYVNQFASMVDRIAGTHGYWKQHPAQQCHWLFLFRV